MNTKQNDISIIYTVVTTDNTIGTVTMNRQPYDNEKIVIHLRDDNDNSFWLTKTFKAILSQELL